MSNLGVCIFGVTAWAVATFAQGERVGPSTVLVGGRAHGGFGGGDTCLGGDRHAWVAEIEKAGKDMNLYTPAEAGIAGHTIPRLVGGEELVARSRPGGAPRWIDGTVAGGRTIWA